MAVTESPREGVGSSCKARIAQIPSWPHRKTPPSVLAGGNAHSWVAALLPKVNDSFYKPDLQNIICLARSMALGLFLKSLNMFSCFIIWESGIFLYFLKVSETSTGSSPETLSRCTKKQRQPGLAETALCPQRGWRQGLVSPCRVSQPLTTLVILTFCTKLCLCVFSAPLFSFFLEGRWSQFPA